MSESLPVQDVAEDAFRGLRNFSYHTTQLRRSPETVGFHSVLSLVMQQDRALSQCYARIMEANPNFRPSRALSFHLVWELAEQYSHLLRKRTSSFRKRTRSTAPQWTT